MRQRQRTHRYPQPPKKSTALHHGPPYTTLPAASIVKSSNMAAMVELGWWMVAICINIIVTEREDFVRDARTLHCRPFGPIAQKAARLLPCGRTDEQRSRFPGRTRALAYSLQPTPCPAPHAPLP